MVMKGIKKMMRERGRERDGGYNNYRTLLDAIKLDVQGVFHIQPANLRGYNRHNPGRESIFPFNLCLALCFMWLDLIIIFCFILKRMNLVQCCLSATP